MVGAHNEITELKQKEFLQQQTIQHLQAILNSTGDLVFVINDQLIIKEFYDSGNEKILLQPEEFLNKKIDTIPFPSEVKKNIIKTIEETFESKNKKTIEYAHDFPHAIEYFQLSVTSFTNNFQNEEVICEAEYY